MYELYITHIICSLIAAYVISKLLKSFIIENSKNKLIEIITYLAYYAGSLIIYFKVGVPGVMLIYNMVSFYILTYNYKSNFKARFLAALYTYCILFAIEMLIAAITGYIYFPFDEANTYSSVFGEVANQLAGLLVIRLVCHKKITQSIGLPWIYWLCINAIPVFSLYFLVILLNVGNLSRLHVILTICLLLFINFSVMVLCDLIISSLTERTKNILLKQQNVFYERQMELLQNSLKTSGRLQHNLKSHLISIKTYLDDMSINEAGDYIDKMLNLNTDNSNEISQTGNPIIDSILNWKFKEAADKKINIDAKIKIPERLDIDSFNITIILGNILDNAIEAAGKVEESRNIDIILIYDRGRLLFNVKNSYSNQIKMIHNELVTSKEEQYIHGIGMHSVKCIIQKYNGTMDISYNEKWFKTSIMLYI